MSVTREILLGHEVDIGEPVYVDPDHLIATGQTRMAGKTVTLNALVSRSGRRAIAFRTKRGEMAFDAVKNLKPFYTEPRAQRSRYISWQYVKSILEASQGRAMNFEEAWIIRSCDGARDLRDVYENIKRLQEEARRGIDENQYLKLTAYFDVILPQLEEREYSSSLKLEKGINLMDLEPLTFEMRCLVMERTLSHVMERMKDVVIMLPEGWKYVPEKLTTPVKAAAIGMAREGASIRNHIWVDSQDLRGVDKELVGQCTTWLLGVQVEENEARRTRISLGNRVSVKDIQGLRLGHFYLRNKDNELIHVYVLPAGVPEEMGRKVATGALPVQVVSDYLVSMKEKQALSDEEMYRQENERLIEENRDLRRQLEELQEVPDVEPARDQDLEELREQLATAQTEKEGLEQDVEELRGRLPELEKVGELEETIQGLEEDLSSIRVGAQAVSELRGALIRILGLDVVDVSREEPTGPSSMATNEVVAIVDDRLSQVLQKLPEVRLVTVDVDEAAKDVLKEDFVSDVADKIRGLSTEPKRVALIIREKTPIRTSELYFIMRGKKGRIPGNFYQQIHRLEKVHLATYTKNTGLVSWNLDAFLEERLRGLCDEETLSQVNAFLVSLLLPEAQA